MAYDSRFFKAYNTKCESYNREEFSIFWLLSLGAKDLSSGVICGGLPHGDFLGEKIPIEIAMETSDDSYDGYFVVVGLECPQELHGHHNDYPLAPEHLHATTDALAISNCRNV